MSTTYFIHNADVAEPERTYGSLLSAEQIELFIASGVAVADQPMAPEDVAVLSGAIDALAAAKFDSASERTYQTEFAGQYLRDPHRLDPRLLTVPLADYGVADTVRTLIGPRVVLRNSNVRITHPGTGDGTIWHTDFRPHVSPAALVGAPPVVVTVLIYLDRADASSGPLFVVPGSHAQPVQPPAHESPLDEEVELRLEPGAIVFMNAALWHRGGRNLGSSLRRLLTLQLSTVYFGTFNFEATLPSVDYQRLVERAIRQKDEPLLELLDLGGVNPASARY